MTHIDFLTKSYVSSLVGSRKLLDDYSGFFNKKGDCLYLLDYDKLSDHLNNDYYSVVLHKMAPLYQEKIKSELGLKVKQNFSYKNVIYLIDNDFFDLVGHKYKKIRHALSFYKNDDIQLIDSSRSFSDILDLAEKWKNARKEKLVFMNMSLERNYYENYFGTGTNIVLKFYLNGALIGYNVIERIDNNRFNLFFGRIDYDYNYLFYYIDYYTYKYIYENISGKIPYYINVGCGIGSLVEYKLKCFPVFCVETLKDFKILN